jgi:hypothetical protein
VADQTGAPEPSGAIEEPSAAEPKLAPLFLLYTFGRLAIAAVLIALLWALGLPGTPGFLFGVLLAMPVSFFALAPVRTRLTSALAVRAERKEALRVQLRGSDDDDEGRRP